MKMILIIIASLIAALVILYFWVMSLPQFGAIPSGQRKERILKSAQYKKDKFENQSYTTTLKEGVGYIGSTWDFFFKKSPDLEPKKPISSIKTDLNSVKDSLPTVVWFGHSSYLIKYKGKNILVDPVLSGYASPFSFTGKAYEGADIYRPEDMPDLDLIIITHDHFDHLDYESIKALAPRTKAFHTALGVGSHLERFGVSAEKITESDWFESHELALGDTKLKITTLPARHMSGRTLTQLQTLWASYMLEFEGYKIYVGGDSGYDTHFAAIGKQFGAIDLAILECGQYGENWPLIHLFPEEVAAVAIELNAKAVLPVHWAKFTLGQHAWYEPIERFLKASEGAAYQVGTPVIGQPMPLNGQLPQARWWESCK